MTVLNVILIVVLVLQLLMIFTLGRLPIDPKEKALEDEEQLLYLRKDILNMPIRSNILI